MSITCSEIENLSHFRQKSKVHFGIYLFEVAEFVLSVIAAFERKM